MSSSRPLVIRPQHVVFSVGRSPLQECTAPGLLVAPARAPAPGENDQAAEGALPESGGQCSCCTRLRGDSGAEGPTPRQVFCWPDAVPFVVVDNMTKQNCEDFISHYCKLLKIDPGSAPFYPNLADTWVFNMNGVDTEIAEVC